MNSLERSILHLKTIDEIFSSYTYDEKELYLTFKRNIETINNTYAEKFTDELYVGGKGGRGESAFGRQMILSDIFEYIVNGRGYYYEMELKKQKAFVELVLNLINQLIIWDSLTVNAEMRKKVLTDLKDKPRYRLHKKSTNARKARCTSSLQWRHRI